MKVNVRQHKRNTKHKVADVRNHSRSLRDKEIVAIVPLKDLRYKQARAIFPGFKPNGDWDKDGVKNKKDCRPFDAMRQDDDAQDLIDNAYDWTEEEEYLIEHEDDNDLENIERAEREAAAEFERQKRLEAEAAREREPVFATPQDELSQGSWDILTGRKIR